MAGASDEEIYAADSDGDSPIKRLLIAETPRGSNTITVVKQTPGWHSGYVSMMIY